jgi:hypothetical protein
LLACVLALAAVVLAAVARPEWFLSQRAAAAAIRYLARDYAPSWDELELGIRSKAWFKKEISVRGTDICFKAREAGLHGCVKSLDAQATLSWSWDGIQLSRLDKLLLQGEKMRLDLAAAAPSAPGRQGLAAAPALLPAPLLGLRLGQVSVDLPDLEIVSASATLRGALRLQTQPEQRRPLRLQADLRVSTSAGARRYHARAAAASDALSGSGLSFIDAEAELSGGGAQARLEADIRETGHEQLRSSFRGSGRLGPWRCSFSGQAKQTPKDLTAAGALQLSSASGTLRALVLRPFTLALAPGSGPQNLKLLMLSSPFQARLADNVLPRALAAARTLRGRISLDARASPRFRQGDHFDATLAAALEPVKDWFEARGGLQASLSGRSGRLPESLEVRHKLDLSLKVARFSRLVALLSGKPYAVPAPLNELEGPLSLEVHSAGDLQHDPQQLRYVLRSDLAGMKQRLKAALAGRLTVTKPLRPERSYKLAADLTLDEVALQLPPLKVTALPAMAPDSRIKHPAELAAGAPAPAAGLGDWAMRLSVRTSTPAVLYSNLAQTPVPVAVELTAASPPAAWDGTITFRSFRVRLFRRDAVIDHIRLAQAPGGKSMALDGLVVYRTAEAVVFIHLAGDTAQPRVEFDSQPPLNRQEIIALLLYGKSPDELDLDQQATLANTQGAMSDNAFGLASLYLFASTPVDYVGYDSVTNSYNVKFHVPGGASLTLGSNLVGTQSAALRQRLAPHWAIQTLVEHEPEQANVVTTVLQWFSRY